MKIFCIMCVAIIFINCSFPQTDSSKLIKYTPEFEFKEGIYLDFMQVKNNNPIPKSRIISSLDPNSRDFFDKLFTKDKIFVYDSYGMKVQIHPNNIWGYSDNGFIYIALSEGFHRISIVGSVCHFVADITVYSTYYSDPYYSGTYYSSMRPVSTKSTELRQYLLDFKTGKVYDYSIQGLEIILMYDPELYDEFMGLKKRKKKQLKFFYLRKYNERNPLYFQIDN